MANFIVTTLADELDAADTIPATADPNDISLREALALAGANGAGTADAITFHPSLAGGTLTLTLGQLAVSGNVSINGDVDGNRRADITIDGNDASRVFHVSAGTSTLESLTITNGRADGASLDDRSGGGAFIAADATVTILNTTFAENHATWSGGAIRNDGTASLFNTTLDSNSALSGFPSQNASGGGIANVGTATLVNTTLFGNLSENAGGGISNSGALTLIDSTLTRNNASLDNHGGFSGPATLINSIVAGNSSRHGDQFSASLVTFMGVNVISQLDAGRPGIDIVETDILNIFASPFGTSPPFHPLPQLVDNGGPVHTVALRAGGAAHNTGDSSALPPDTADLDHDGNIAEPLPVDARGQSRITNGLDVGAAEVAFPRLDDAILWLNPDGWLRTANQTMALSSDHWDLAATGDFDHDGDSDLIWRHEDGGVMTWEVDDGVYVRNHHLPDVSLNWQIVDTGDFNGDGDAELLWRHRDGAVVTWDIENGVYRSTQNIEFASSGWEIDGVGDFDHDGDSDILWRHRDGAVVTWEMEDGAYVRNHNIAFASTNWRIEETGDFDRDGDDDIVWRHRDGAVVTWEMENGSYVQNHNIAVVSANWRVEGAHDFNGDGTDDILWRHTDGQVVTWEMSGDAVNRIRNFGVVSNEWQIVATGEFDVL